MDKCAFIWFYIYLDLFIYIYPFSCKTDLKKLFFKDWKKSGKESRVKVRKNKRKTKACVFKCIK